MTAMNGVEHNGKNGGGQGEEKGKENGGNGLMLEGKGKKSLEGDLTTKNIKMKQYLCVKHALPKTRLTNAILYENVSQQRHLEMKLGSISTRRHRMSSMYDFSKRAFVAQQNRKQTKWKRDDEVRVAAMNLPQIGWDSPDRREVTVMYHNPAYQTRAETAITGSRKPVLPMMTVRRERTEIVSCREKTFVTKLPSVVEVDQCKLNKHNAYTGKQLLERGSPSRDERFRRLETSLSPALRREKQEVAMEGSETSATTTPGLNPSPSLSEPVSRPKPSVRTGSRPMSHTQGTATRNDMVSEQSNPSPAPSENQGQPRVDIVKAFRSGDLKELARSLSFANLPSSARPKSKRVENTDNEDVR